MTGSTELERLPEERGPDPAAATLVAVLDLGLGVAASALSTGEAVGRRVGSALAPVARPVAGLALRPPLLHPRYQPATLLARATHRGDLRRTAIGREVSRLLDALVPVVADAMLRRIDLTAAVGRYVDIDALVAGVDLDSIVQRLDLNRIVREQVDLDGLVATVDVEAVINRVDLVGLTESIIDEIDLPEIIRESTGSVASETVRGVRMQGVSADDALDRALERFRLRRRAYRAADLTPDDLRGATHDGAPGDPSATREEQP
ncbi:hypothetical protein [Nocardioides taihuensis]|uniref:Asp23/Gls24 family envelope stress response protein n=1 Tax=Nocardioides taihuensis TaxID=1835606 RepID=A0ABW0BJB5_9ACTN